MRFGHAARDCLSSEFAIDSECVHPSYHHPDIRGAADRIRQGGVVAFPTETVYGLGANAFDAKAVARIFEIKERPHFDPLIVHVADSKMLDTLVESVPAPAYALIDQFWPGPLTLVLPKLNQVPDIVTSGLSTVGVRMPAHPVAQELIAMATVPIAAPSANLFGGISPTCALHVKDQLETRVDQVLDGGPCRVGLESTIVTFDQGKTVVLRVGGTPIEELERVVGDVVVAHDHDDLPQSPGRLLRHYAPQTPLYLRECAAPPMMSGKIGLLTMSSTSWDDCYEVVELLSTNDNLTEAATNLFAAMRRLDAMDLEGIEAIRVPDTGLGRAINDRLQRAAYKRKTEDS